MMTKDELVGPIARVRGDAVVVTTMGAVRAWALFVLENRTYEITGNQTVPGAGAVDFAAMARAAGFKRAYVFDTAAACDAQCAEALAGDGPVFVVARVHPGQDRPMRRAADVPERYLQVSLAESARIVRRALR
jgi:thiamine pyrophosphate-dependent acetolactate synthase large subunit-like protein